MSSEVTQQAELQWGRAHVSAEGRSIYHRMRSNRLASMGPRSRERGGTARLMLIVLTCSCFNGAALT